MIRLLGEPVRVDSLEPGQLLWHDQEFRLITQISVTEDDSWLIFIDGYDPIYFVEDDLVMRGCQYVWGKDD